ncbi:hypothetical protein AC579_7444 [Pseudocercospora musae]|uniref:Uncharacterized protein n=1 Tax=Pseudocercospora musae TaxID=113226 RepID=A0A139IQU6_9PEZI|nr:hypothetical protein AC579_7444 [Pseudocercospora musae]
MSKLGANVHVSSFCVNLKLEQGHAVVQYQSTAKLTVALTVSTLEIVASATAMSAPSAPASRTLLLLLPSLQHSSHSFLSRSP